MNTKTKARLASLTVFIIFNFITAAFANRADYVLTNGKVYTVNEKQPWAEAVAVDSNEIVYVGDNGGAKAFIGEGTEQIDLKKRLLLPGFVESHIHVMMGAGLSSGLALTVDDSIDDVLNKLEEYADANPGKETLFGASYNAFLFDAKANRGRRD